MERTERGITILSNSVKKLRVLLLILCLACAAAALPVQAAGSATPAASVAKGGKWVKTGSGKKYRLKDGTYAQNQWLKIGGKYYYFLKSGLMAKNRMITTDGKTYYVKANGVRIKSSWIKKNGKSYYFDKNGVRAQKKWIRRSGKLYYVGADGAIAKNQWVDGGKYYVGADGLKLKNCVKNGYYLNADGKKVVKVFKGDYIFVGDSRMVGMQKAIAPADTLYIAKVGEGYSWLKSTAGVKLKYYLKANPNVKVVLALGVNDLGNVKSYISYYKKLIKNFPKTKFYILSVNPVDDAKVAKRGYKVKNSAINSFNKKMYVAFRSRYVNTYKEMKADGFGSRDGLHYLEADYIKLYRSIVEKIQ